MGAGGDVLGNGGQDELGQLAGAVEGQTADLVHDGRIGEALEQGVAVQVNVDALNDRHEGLDLFVHHLVDELVELGVLKDLVDVLVASEVGGVGNGRVAGVEEAELVALKLFDLVNVLDELDARLLKGRAARDKSILDDPLGEGLGHDGPQILDAKAVGQGELVVVGRARGDAVDHAVGELAVGLDPVGNLGVARVGEAQQHVASDGTVALDVVARQDGEGRESGSVALLERGQEEAKDGAWGFEVAGNVGDNVRVVDLELEAILIVVVAALGDGQGHNLGVLVGHLVNDLGRVIGGENERVDAANDARIAALARPLEDGVEVILAPQSIADANVHGLQADTADAPFVGPVLAHQVVHVDGEVRAVEAADPDVDDALLDICAVKARELDLCAVLLCGLRDQGQVVIVEVDAGELCPALCPGRVELVASRVSKRGLHSCCGAGAAAASLLQAVPAVGGCGASQAT